jgi:transposase
METVGIDVGKTWLDVAYLSPEGTAHTTRAGNTPDGIATLVAALRPAPPVLIALEATGAYHRPLLAALVTAGLPVALVNPAQLKAFRQSGLGRHKTDRADALLLARFARLHGNELRRATPADPLQAQLRALVGYREGLVTQRTRLRNRAHAATWDGDATVQQWIADDLAQVETRLAAVEAALAALVRDLPEATVVRAVPGVGPRVAAIVLALLPRALWGHAKAAAAYAGVHPRQAQSGVRSQSRLSKQGTPLLRRVLYLAALVAITHDAALRAVYDRHVARGHAPKSGLCVVMHKLLRRMMGELRAHYAAQATAPALAT